MNNYNAPPDNIAWTGRPAKTVESESNNATKRRKTKHISRACNPCRIKYVLSLCRASPVEVAAPT